MAEGAPDPAAGEVWAIVLAAGGGTRFGAPKQFLDLAGRSLLDRAVDSVATVADGVVVALPAAASWHPAPNVRPPVIRVPGGAARHQSVRAALAAVPDTAAVIVVADAAHPLATPDLAQAVVAAVRAGADGAVPGLPLTEVLADVDAAGARVAGLPRLPDPPAAVRVLVQTPQAFNANVFRSAHASSSATAEDSELVASCSGRIVVVPGEPGNVHVTTPAELTLASTLAASRDRARTSTTSGAPAGQSSP